MIQAHGSGLFTDDFCLIHRAFVYATEMGGAPEECGVYVWMSDAFASNAVYEKALLHQCKFTRADVSLPAFREKSGAFESSSEKE